MNSSSDFREAVYDLARKIPHGKVATYGQLASLVGRPGAARAVGMFMRTNQHPESMPCYKVVASDGSLTGYSAGEGIITKRQMLLHDGVAFNGDKVDLRISQWQPTV